MAINGKPAAAGMLIFTTLAWGAMFIVAKGALGTLDAFWLSALRYGPAALVMLTVLSLVEGGAALLPGRAALPLWLFGSLGFAGFSILGFLGIARSRPEHAAIIAALMPLIGALMNWVFRGRRPGGVTLVAMLVALFGAALVITHGRLDFAAAGTLPADALVLAGVVSWIGYTMGASFVPRFSTLRYTALSMALGAVTIIAATLVASAAGLAHVPQLRDLAPLAEEIAYLSLVAGVLAVLAWNAGIAVLGPASGVLFINFVPITTFAIGIAQGHRFGASEIAGVALVIAALVANALATRPSSAAPRFASRAKFA